MGSSYIPNIHAIVGNQRTRRDLVFIIRTPLYSSYSCHGAYGIKGSPAIDTHVPNLDVIECHPIHIQWSYLDCLISTCTCYPTSIGMPVHSQARAIVSAHFLLIQCPWIPHIPFLKEMSQSDHSSCVNALPGWCRLQKQLQTRDGLKDWIEHRVQILICLRNDNVIVIWVLVNPNYCISFNCKHYHDIIFLPNIAWFHLVKHWVRYVHFQAGNKCDSLNAYARWSSVLWSSQ